MLVLREADHACDEETRRSTSCCQLHVGGHLVECESCKQQVLAVNNLGWELVLLAGTWQCCRDLPLAGCGCASLRSALRRAIKAGGVPGLIGNTWCLQTSALWTSDSCSGTLSVATRGCRRWTSGGERCLDTSLNTSLRVGYQVDKQRRAALISMMPLTQFRGKAERWEQHWGSWLACL